MKIAPEGYPYILFFIAITMLSFVFFGKNYSLIPLGLTGFMLFFFRDPERKIPEGDHIYTCPADGRIILIQHIFEDKFLKKEAIQVSIFMSPLNVHINRIPCSGIIKDVIYSKGKFFSAFKPEAHLYNENISILLESQGDLILLRQIAGSIARRAVCRVRKGDLVEKGQRFGIIKFSSRVDIYLPTNTQLKVVMGQKVKAGETILGEKLS
ncbi:MAG: phosphatidylserine decarboxylase family protein [Thermodesulfovibrionales bacterium]|nr:phosphatidylserine decarboxylase family protein [Thermodesulfovibrionales bacterium]